MPRDQFSPASPGAAADRGEPVVPSRRSVLRGAAGVGAAGIAATAFAGLGGRALAATAKPAAASDTSQAIRPHEAGPELAESDQIVVHLRDARTGQIDLFRGTSQVRVRDTDLAARILQASQSSAGATVAQVR